jgi:hypothetical protein
MRINNKFLAPLVAFFAIFGLAACGSQGASDNKAPTSLTGDWTQVGANKNGWFVASISGETIQVNLEGRDSSSIFWMGSFDTSRHTVGKYKVVSIPDPDARKVLDGSLMATTEATKTFTYDHGVISFEFSALGSSTIVHLKQTKTYIPTYTRTVKPTATSSKASTLRTPSRITKTSKVKATPKATLGKKK